MPSTVDVMLTTALYTDEIASLAVSDFTDDTAAAVVVSTPSYTLPLFPLAALAMPYPAPSPVPSPRLHTRQTATTFPKVIPFFFDFTFTS